MVTTSEFDGGRRTVSFDRVELGGPNFPEHPFELSQTIDLTGDGLPTVTWVYDSADDTVTWSSPLEELFGFPVGVRGFSVVQGADEERARGLEAAGRLLRPGRHRRRPARPDPHPDPGRRAACRVRPPLHGDVPRRDHPGRGRPRLAPPATERRPDDRHALRRRGHRRHRPAAVRVRAERPGRPLPPPDRGHPRRGDRPPGRPPRLRQPGRRQALQRGLHVGPLRRAGHRLGPPRRHQRHDRAPGSPDRARPVLRARRGPRHRPRRRP